MGEQGGYLVQKEVHLAPDQVLTQEVGNKQYRILGIPRLNYEGIQINLDSTMKESRYT